MRVTQLLPQGIYGFSQAHGEGWPHRQCTWTHHQLQPLLIACRKSVGLVPALLVTGATAMHSTVSGRKPAGRARRDGFSPPCLA